MRPLALPSLFISRAAPFLRCCTLFLFPRLSSSPLFSGSSHLNFSSGVVCSHSRLLAGAFQCSGWRPTACHTAGPGAPRASTISWILLARNCKGSCLVSEPRPSSWNKNHTLSAVPYMLSAPNPNPTISPMCEGVVKRGGKGMSE